MHAESGFDDATFVARLREALTQAAAFAAIATPPAPQSVPDQLLTSIVMTAARTIPAPEGALFLVDWPRRLLTFDVVIGGTAAAVRDLTVPLGHGIAGLVAVSGQPLAVANAQDDPRHARDIAAQAGYFPSTILAVPVTTRDGAVVGVLELLDRQEAPTFSLTDMDLLGQFAQLVTIALELRQYHRAHSMLIDRVLAMFAGLPPKLRQRLEAQTEQLATELAADAAAQRALALARLTAHIASHGDAEERICRGVLTAVADYLEDRPLPGMGLTGRW